MPRAYDAGMEDGLFQSQRVGILGGTFDPIHLGHLILAQTAVEMLDLSRLLLVPCGDPPHKSVADIAPARHRLAMVEAALEDDLVCEPCGIEVHREGPSYSIDTVQEVRARFPDAGIYFIIGADTITELHSWHRIGELLQLCTVVTFRRPGVSKLTPEDLKLPGPIARVLLENVMESRLVEISSSDIRYRIAEGMSIRYLVPQEVTMYISEHRLYGSA